MSSMIQNVSAKCLGRVAPKFPHGENCGVFAKNTTLVALLAIGAVATALATLSLLGNLSITCSIGSFSTIPAIVTLAVGGALTVGTIVGLILYNVLRNRDAGDDAG